MNDQTMTLSARLEGTAANLAIALEGDDHDITIDREEAEHHVAFLREAAKDAAALEARPVLPTLTIDPDAAPIEQRMAVAGSKLYDLLAEAHVVPTSGATFGAGLLSDCARLLVEGHAQIVVARQQVREQGAELFACKAAAEHGLGAVDSEGLPSFTVSLLATEHHNLQARLAELEAGYREEAGKDGAASDIEFAVRLGACLVSQQMERLVESGIDGSLVATLQAHLPSVDAVTRGLLATATSTIAALSTVLSDIRTRLTRGEDIVGNAAARGLQELGQAYFEATGGKTATTRALVEAIHRGAR